MIAIPLVFSLTTGLASPLVDALPPAAVAPEGLRAVSLRIDHAALLDHERAAVVEDTVSFVREDATQVLARDHGVTVVEDPGTAAILLTLSWVSYEDSIYGVTIETQRPGEAPRSLERFECECINSGLAKAIVERLPGALEQLAPAAEATPVGPAVEGSAAGPVDDRRERSALGVEGKVGVGLLAAGVAGAVAGGVVFAQGRRLTEDDSEREVWLGRNYRPPGVAVMVTGGALAVTGVVLLVVDRVRAQRKRPAGEGTARVMPSRRGLALTFRF